MFVSEATRAAVTQQFSCPFSVNHAVARTRNSLRSCRSDSPSA